MMKHFGGRSDGGRSRRTRKRNARKQRQNANIASDSHAYVEAAAHCTQEFPHWHTNWTAQSRLLTSSLAFKLCN